MPNQDGTGPQGKGSKTGRGMGKCGQKTNSQKPQGLKKRMGMRRGRGQRQQQNNEDK